MTAIVVCDALYAGEISLDDDQMIFTSIPYDEGWKVYIDGEEVKTFKTAEAFLAVEADVVVQTAVAEAK